MKNTQSMEIIPPIEAYTKSKGMLEQLYTTENGKKFIHHLIYAFHVEKPHCILFSKSKLIDCLSGSILQPVSTKENPIDKSYIDLFIKVKDATEEDKPKLQKELDDKLFEYVSSTKLTRIAVRSDKTDRIIGLEELQSIYDFANDQIKKGNKIIKGMLRPSNNNTRSKRSTKTKELELKDKLEALKNKYNKR